MYISYVFIRIFKKGHGVLLTVFAFAFLDERFVFDVLVARFAVKPRSKNQVGNFILDKCELLGSNGNGKKYSTLKRIEINLAAVPK